MRLRPRSRKNSALPEPVPRAGSPTSQVATASTLVSASGAVMSIQSSALKPLRVSPGAAEGSRVTTRWPMRVRRAFETMGPISRAGSSTTAEPVQVRRVGMPMAVVL